MKKIVALVLSLVMVLGLATTAFAATTSTGSVATTSVTPVKAAVYTLATAGGSMTEVAATVEKIDLTTVSGKVVADVPMNVPSIYAVTFNTGVDYFIEVAKADATHALKNNGAYVYLYNCTEYGVDTVVATYATPVVLDSLVLPADDEIDCGDAYTTVTTAAGTVDVVAAYYTSGKNVYYADGTDFAYFNGQFVSYNKASKNAVAFDAHDFDAETVLVKATDVKGVVVPVSIECEDCEKTFTVVNSLAFDNTWVKGVNYTTDAAIDAYNGALSYYILLTGATDANTQAPATDAADTVESAKTFDAGIAMYVGMSVMAAAGSAVVLKKKD